ncbi:helix-turn-helix transcriptional regulator [Maribacter litopenaei]|uniref:Helix-turn-helix transcriptional regulator n=1 Tax=Maribacter litopenaei TaxID=2976127 RepID=A0ABY5Y831_9FLAO|nr:helix-turn-helix transcriptional regulator [Maribacter litopenaei]UWX54527.1 helix-turn-helix transcriptional regulator [Maribacter litopenaei]
MKRLEGQFPIKDSSQVLKFRTASDFANELNIHVNSLNRCVKLYTGRSTTENINRSLLKEAKRLLRKKHWPIHKVGLVLGFKEPNHFSSFFKKYESISPTEFRSKRIK